MPAKAGIPLDGDSIMKIHFAFVACLALAGCNDVPTAAHSVGWYKEHAQEREDRLAKCDDDVGLDPDCLNAQQAENELANARKGIAPLTPIGKGGER
jgi:hypothetical protein